MGLTEILLVVAVGGGIVAVLLATFKGAAGEVETDEADMAAVTPQAASRPDLLELEERQRVLTRSIEEIEADHEAGNLTESDYASLKQRYAAELASLGKQLGAAEISRAAAPAQRPIPAAAGPRWSSIVGWAGGTVGFIALAWLVMSTALRPRVGDDSITGSLPGQDAAAGAIADVDMEQMAALQRRLSENPNDVEALNELGHMYLTLQQYPALAEVTRRALEAKPDDPEALTHLGMLLFSTEHPEGVVAAFDRALEIDPDFTEALQFKGMVSFMRQDYATAVTAWERYLEVIPGDQAPPRIKAMLEMARANAGTAGETVGQ